MNRKQIPPHPKIIEVDQKQFDELLEHAEAGQALSKEECQLLRAGFGSPDAESLNTDVFVMPASGGRPVPVVSGPHDDRLLDWTPDGRRVLVASNRSGAYDAWSKQVDGGRAEGSPVLLRKDLGMVFPIGFSPDGSYYFAPDLGVRDVVLVDWNVESQKAASAPVPATEHFSGSTRLPAWSPDRRRLAFLVDHGFLRPAGAQRIRDIETGAERTLVNVNGSVNSLSWSLLGFGKVPLLLSRLIAAIAIGYIVFLYAEHTGRRKWLAAGIFVVLTIIMMQITYYYGW